MHKIAIIVLYLFFVVIVQAQQKSIPVHDPVIIQQDSLYHIFCTGRGISEWVSSDCQNWTKQKPLFDTLPWAVETIQGFKNHVWAPDISFYKDKYYLYYSISTFGKNTSCIGVATNSTLNRNDTNYHWQDAGKLICSQQGKDNFNAIDPNLIVDVKGKPWLSFGSFWSGIQLVELNDDALGVKQPQQIINIAKRDKASIGNTALEAPFIYFKNGFYYLFVSADLCCKASESTYKILVGRSKQIIGPYLDKENKSMLNGGGSLIKQGDGINYYAVGHNAVTVLNGKEFIVYHGYDVNDKGKSKLVMKELLWDKDGWPIVKE
jgi:arabinan endo-1,5-alpha-L-arabinosidase